MQGYDLRLQSMNSVSQKVDPNMAFSATHPSGGRGRGTGRGRGNFNGGFNSKGRGFFQPARTAVSIALTPLATQTQPIAHSVNFNNTIQIRANLHMHLKTK